MSRYLKNQSGETIVEVIVSFVLLLMFTALFVVSLRYARTMSLKAETIRQTAYAQCEKLYPAGDGKPQWLYLYRYGRTVCCWECPKAKA